MTKSQSNQAFSTSATQQGQNSQNAQSSYNAATGDIGDYKSALAQYAAANPYTQGGSYQTAADQQLSDSAAGGAQGAQQAIQASMIRSGGNPAAGVAAGEQVAEQNARTGMDEQAKVAQQQATGLANYNAGVVSASAKPEEMEQQLMQSQLQGEEGALGNETNASKTPSWWQELGQGVLSAGTAYAGGLAKSCWIAARVFGGWDDRRTILVRSWMFLAFGETWYGWPLLLLYILFGEWIAERLMPRSRIATRVFTWLFAKALKCAEKWAEMKFGPMSAGERLAEVL